VIEEAEEANSSCNFPGCYGEGIVHHYFKDVKNKTISSDWSYCQSCYPSSTSELWQDDHSGKWEEIDIEEYDLLEQQGFREISK
jgi:hypothetical protein